MSGLINKQKNGSEQHFTGSEAMRDIVIGMADGLTVPFALAAGIAGAVDSIQIIVTAGLAEIAAGAIAMGLGGYLAARTSETHYASERGRELYEIDNMYDREIAETKEIFSEYGLKEPQLDMIVNALAQNKSKWADFMMRYELGLEKPISNRALTSAITIGSSYIVGGLIPLSSYIFLNNVDTALLVSVFLTTAALGVFGAIRGYFTGISPIKSAMQTVLVGGLAAAAAYAIASYISH